MYIIAFRVSDRLYYLIGLDVTTIVYTRSPRSRFYEFLVIKYTNKHGPVIRVSLAWLLSHTIRGNRRKTIKQNGRQPRTTRLSASNVRHPLHRIIDGVWSSSSLFIESRFRARVSIRIDANCDPRVI